MKPTDFPKLQAVAALRGEKVLARFNDAVEMIAEGLEAKSIFNVDLKDAKDCLNRRMDEADAVLRSVWTNSGAWERLPAEVFSLLQGLSSNLSNVHGAIAASKKLSSTKLSHPAITAYAAVAAEGLVLAQALVTLKPMVVSGRKPNPDVEARKAAKLNNPKAMKRATCACCFAEQAVLPSGFIHDHGYTLPQAWMKTASCYGRQFQPLETSDAGLHFMADLLKRYIAETTKALAEAPARKTVTKTNRYKGTSVVLNKGDAGFDYELKSIIFGLEQALKSAKGDLAKFEAAISSWAPKAY
jgi:hypothetical protein